APVQGHNNFQNGHEFIQRGGQRGPQKDLLLPGTYYIDPLLFKVIAEKAAEGRPGEGAVMDSKFCKAQTKGIRTATGTWGPRRWKRSWNAKNASSWRSPRRIWINWTGSKVTTSCSWRRS